MFIDPNFETLSGEFLARDIWRATSGEPPGGADGGDTDWMRRLWRRAVAMMTGTGAGVRKDQRGRGAAH